MLRLNLGCGLEAPAGWVNIDRSPGLTLSRHPRVRGILHRAGIISDAHIQDWPTSIVRHDVTRGLPYADDVADAVYSSHMLEHLYLDDALRLLEECGRVLHPGGTLRLALPDADELVADVAARRGCPGTGRRYLESLNAFTPAPPSLRQRLVSPFASSPHRWQPTRDLVFELLDDAGFTDVAEHSFRQGSCPDLVSVEHREHSLFVEATIARESEDRR